MPQHMQWHAVAASVLLKPAHTQQHAVAADALLEPAQTQQHAVGAAPFARMAFKAGHTRLWLPHSFSRCEAVAALHTLSVDARPHLVHSQAMHAHITQGPVLNRLPGCSRCHHAAPERQLSRNSPSAWHSSCCMGQVCCCCCCRRCCPCCAGTAARDASPPVALFLLPCVRQPCRCLC